MCGIPSRVTPKSVTQQQKQSDIRSEYYIIRGLEGLRKGAFHPEEVALIIAQIPTLVTMVRDPGLRYNKDAYLIAVNHLFKFTEKISSEFKPAAWEDVKEFKSHVLSQLSCDELHRDVATIVSEEFEWLIPTKTVYQPYLDALKLLVTSW